MRDREFNDEKNKNDPSDSRKTSENKRYIDMGKVEDDFEAHMKQSLPHDFVGVNASPPKNAPKSNRKIILLLIFLLFLVAGLYIAYLWASPSKIKGDISDYYEGYNEETYSILWNNTWIFDETPILENGWYLPVSFIKTYIDMYIFEDEQFGRVTITTDNKTIRMGTEELNYYINDQVMSFNLPVIHKNGNMYLALEMFLELYHVAVEIDDTSRILIIDSKEKAKTWGVILEPTYLRFEEDKKSPYLREVLKDEQVLILDEKQPYVKVRTKDGYMGYIFHEDMQQAYVEVGIVREEIKAHIPTTIQKPIVMGFDLIGAVAGNEGKKKTNSAINVLSPTWFSLDMEKKNGELITLADKGYVDFAHEQGYQVWGLFSDNYTKEICNLILTDAVVRETVIRQLLAYAAMYELDGINIDLETVTKDNAAHYVQFFRELAPFMKEQKLILSVDMYVPAAYNMFYNREEVGKVVDYMIIMTYDEHYSGSKIAGPVASLPFVEKGVADTLQEVSKEKIIMGIPFYNRLWLEAETAEGVFEVSSPGAYGMNTTRGKFEAEGSAFYWDETIGSYYSEFTIAETTEKYKKGIYKVWLEDPRSVDEKLAIAEKNELAGVAFWSRGLESEEVWPVIDAYVSRMQEIGN